MKLYIKYKVTVTDSYRAEEQWGEWYCNKDFELLSVHRKQPATSWKNEVEVLDVDFDIEIGEEVHILYMIFSSGNSFGTSTGESEIIWAFKNIDMALAAKELWEKAEIDWIVETTTDSGKILKLSNPAAGYFENISSINLETFVLEK